MKITYILEVNTHTDKIPSSIIDNYIRSALIKYCRINKDYFDGLRPEDLPSFSIERLEIGGFVGVSDPVRTSISRINLINAVDQYIKDLKNRQDRTFKPD